MKPFSVRELIIEVQQQVQRAGSYKRDKLFEPFILWRLNTAQDRIIKKRIKPDPNGNPNRFMIDEKYRADIQPIIKPEIHLRTYYDRKNQAYAYLPYDFEYLVADQSVILLDCKEEFKNPTEAVNFSLQALTFPESGLGTGPFYRSLKIQNATTSVTLQAYSIDGVSSKQEKFELVEYLINKLDELSATLSTPWKTYWEKYKNYYFPDSFILVGDVGIPPLRIVADDILGATSPKVYTETRYKIYDGDIKPNRGIQNDFVRDMYNNYYDRPTPDSPVTSLADNKIFVNTSERFLVSEILIDYIRKPRRISLSLNQTSELPGTVHEEICSVATELILSNIEAGNYQAKVQENITRLE